MGYRVHTSRPTATRRPARSPTSRSSRAYDDLDALRALRRRASTSSPSSSRTCRSTALSGHRERGAGPAAPDRCCTRRSTAAARRASSPTHGLPVAPFALVGTLDELSAALAQSGPAGRPQDRGVRLRRQGPGRASTAADDAGRPGIALGRQPRWSSRRFVDFERELSVVAARGLDGRIAHYPAHRERARPNTSSTSRSRRRAVPRAGRARRDRDRPRRSLEALDVVGVLCVELFLTRDGRAARQRAGAAAAQLRPPHHRRLRHQPVRAAAARGVRPAAGRDRAAAPGGDGQPARRPVAGRRAATGPRPVASPDVKLHLYGKARPKPAPKMGHLTALARTVHEAQDHVIAAGMHC